MIKWLITFIVAVAVVFGLTQVFDVFHNTPGDVVAVDSFTDCVEAGFPVMESYPRQCRDDAGNNFIEDLDTSDALTDMIHVTEPAVHATVENVITVLGEARGTWFFEANAPLEVQTREGVVIARSYVEAVGEWMTEEFVPFRGTVDISGFEEEEIILVVKRADPSGEREIEMVEIPLRSKREVVSAQPCFITGCSGHICSDEQVVSTCEFRPEYACYQSAMCERQAPTGDCGWTETEALTTCLADPNTILPQPIP